MKYQKTRFYSSPLSDNLIIPKTLIEKFNVQLINNNKTIRLTYYIKLTYSYLLAAKLSINSL